MYKHNYLYVIKSQQKKLTKMKTLEQIKAVPEINNELSKFIIWRVADKHNWELLFFGTQQECNAEFLANDYDDVNERILPCKIIEQWENDVTGIGHVTFSSGKTLDYSI